MARPLLPDDLWSEIAPLLPPPRPRPNGGRPPIDNRAALTGILFVLRSGLPWEMLPAEMGLRERHEVLAASARLAGGGRVGAAALGAAGAPARGR